MSKITSLEDLQSLLEQIAPKAAKAFAKEVVRFGKRLDAHIGEFYEGIDHLQEATKRKTGSVEALESKLAVELKSAGQKRTRPTDSVDSSDSSSDDSSDSDSDSDSSEEASAPAKRARVTEEKTAEKESDSSSSSDSSDSDDSSAPAKKNQKVVAKAESSSSSDSSSGSSSDDSSSDDGSSSSSDDGSSSDSSDDEEDEKKESVSKASSKKEDSSSDSDSSSSSSEDSGADAEKEDEALVQAEARREEYQQRARNRGRGKNGERRTHGVPFQRVKVDEALKTIKDPRLLDNTYDGTFGGKGWGKMASDKLVQVRGRDFRHEKTKKKRGGYRGGKIDFAVNSIKLGSDSD